MIEVKETKKTFQKPFRNLLNSFKRQCIQMNRCITDILVDFI